MELKMVELQESQDRTSLLEAILTEAKLGSAKQNQC